MTTTNRERSVVLRALVFAAILAATVLMPGRILHAEGPVVSDETMLVEVPVVWEPGEADLYLPFEAPAVGSRTPGSVITANYQDTWPANAQAALEAAIVILENMIVTDIPIVLEAHWEPVAGNTLGFGGPYLRSFGSGVAFPNTWLPAILANELQGIDGTGITGGNPLGAELKLTMNSSWSTWHFGPGPAPSGKVDFTSVALHELIHGLGFTGSMDPVTSTTAKWGIIGSTVYRPTIYDQFTHRGSGSPTKLIDMVAPNTADPALMTALRGQNGGVRFTGPNATAANGGVGAPLYTPSTFVDGSSYSHLAESYNGGPNTLMTYSFQANETVHDPGPVTRGILKDFGYTLQDPPPTPGTLQFSSSTYQVDEATATLNIPVTRAGGSSGAASATCASTGGSATLTNDYSWQTSAVSWLDGDAATKNCVLAIVNDAIPESAETIIIALSNVTGATAGSPTSATVTIPANDPPGSLQFTINEITLYRGGDPGDLPASRTGGSTGEVSAACRADLIAEDGVDYTLLASEVAWANGASSTQSCTLEPLMLGQGSLVFTVSLVDPTGGATIGANDTLTVTLIDQRFDPTCDGQTDAVDALAVIRALAGFSDGVLPVAPCHGDADGTRGLSLGDAVAIRRIVTTLR